MRAAFVQGHFASVSRLGGQDKRPQRKSKVSGTFDRCRTFTSSCQLGVRWIKSSCRAFRPLAQRGRIYWQKHPSGPNDLAWPGGVAGTESRSAKAPAARFSLPNGRALLQGQFASVSRFGGQRIKVQQKHPVRQGESLADRVAAAILAGARFMRFIRSMKRMRYGPARETSWPRQ